METGLQKENWVVGEKQLSLEEFFKARKDAMSEFLWQIERGNYDLTVKRYEEDWIKLRQPEHDWEYPKGEKLTFQAFKNVQSARVVKQEAIFRKLYPRRSKLRYTFKKWVELCLKNQGDDDPSITLQAFYILGLMLKEERDG